jgi:hypothetical protein
MDLGKCELIIRENWGSQCGLNDAELAEDKNNFWKLNVEADWAIVCDVDELLYHPNLLGYLQQCKREGVTFPKIQGYQMYSMDDPFPDKPITETHKRGVASQLYSKRIVFSPKEITATHYTPGAHSCNPKGLVVEEDAEPQLKLLHYKFIGGFEHIKAHYEDRKNFVSETNKINHWSIHYFEQEQRTLLYYIQGLNEASEII